MLPILAQPSSRSTSQLGDTRLDSPIRRDSLDSDALDAPQLPVEIQECVIDSLARPMLPIAAQVSKTWYFQAMHNLYFAVQLTSRKKYDLLVAQLRTSPRVKRWLATTREVVIIAHDSSKPSAKRYTTFLDVFPFVFATALPSLRRLEFRHGLRSLPHPSFHLALGEFRTVTSLYLTHLYFNSVTSMQRIICAFPRMETLTLSWITTEHLSEGSSWDRGRGQLPRLKDLRLMYINENTLLIVISWLIDSGICTDLQNLTIALKSHLGRAYTSACDRQINRLLEACGPALNAFYEVEDHIIFRGHPRCDFSHNTGLRSLRLCSYVSLEFNLELSPPPTGDDMLRRWMSAAEVLREDLSTVRSHRLEHLAIHLPVILFGIVTVPDSNSFLHQLLTSDTGSALHAVMTRSYFDALKRVDVVLDIAYDSVPRKLWQECASQAVQPVVHELFAPWKNRSILAYSEALRLHDRRRMSVCAPSPDVCPMMCM